MARRQVPTLPFDDPGQCSCILRADMPYPILAGKDWGGEEHPHPGLPPSRGKELKWMQRHMVLARRAIPQYHKGCLVSNLMRSVIRRAVVIWIREESWSYPTTSVN